MNRFPMKRPTLLVESGSVVLIADYCVSNHIVGIVS